jgi:hypothetical protein
VVKTRGEWRIAQRYAEVEATTFAPVATDAPVATNAPVATREG